MKDGQNEKSEVFEMYNRGNLIEERNSEGWVMEEGR